MSREFYKIQYIRFEDHSNQFHIHVLRLRDTP